MINLMVTNQKLFHRSVAIVTAFTSATAETGIPPPFPLHPFSDRGAWLTHFAHGVVRCSAATTCLLRAIYKVDTVSSELRAASVHDHVAVAAPQRQLVPLALLLAQLADATVAQCMEMISKEPVLRRLIAPSTTESATK